MKTLIFRTLFLRPSSSPSPFPRLSLLFLHSGAGDELHRRRHDSFSSSSSSSSTSSLRRQHEEESKSVKVSVWWDFENCHIPAGVNVFRVAHRITSALRSSGIRGPITITAFGDVAQLSRATQEALVATGICLNHVPHSGKNSSDRSFMADLVYWIFENPPPAHFFLISGDKDFANILHRLRMSNYNVLLASPDTATGVLCSAATIMWPWTPLIKGEDFSAKHYNHPPDGLYGSWYGHYKGVLEDPFMEMEQVASSQPDESMELTAKPRAVPKAVVNGIRQALYSYPEGINLSELRTELRRNNVIMDKDFFGYKKFSQLLFSMPNIVKLVPPPPGESQPIVFGTHRRVVEPLKPCHRVSKMDNLDEGAKDCGLTQNGKPLPEASPTIVSDTSSTHKESDAALEEGSFDKTLKTLTGPEPVKVEPTVSSKGADVGNKTDDSTPAQERKADTEDGLFRRIWKSLTGPRVGNSNDENFETVKPEESIGQSKSDVSTSLSSSSTSSNTDKSLTEDKARKEDGVIGVKKGLLSWIARLWRPKKSDAADEEHNSASRSTMNGEPTDTHGKPAKATSNASCQPEGHELFSKSYFWDVMETFLLTSKGSDLISKSRTREELVHGLKKECPWVLKDLKETHLFKLIDLLTTEKRWVEEVSSQMFPFRLAFPPKRKCVPSHARGSNGLSSLFTSKTPQSAIENTVEGKRRLLNREKILSDCHNLVKELMEQYPEGFNISIFKPAFSQRYGYELDYKMLGYPKLVSLLQIMPGVRVESSFVLPVELFWGKPTANGTYPNYLENEKEKDIISKNGESQDNNVEDDGWDTLLGPIADSASHKINKGSEEMTKDASFDEATLSDSDFSDNENQSVKGGEEDSSLVQILDSWYSRKEASVDEQCQGVDGLVDCSTSNNEKEEAIKSADLVKRTVRPNKNYSFVSESGGDKEKLVESILGSLKKAGNSSLHS
ncbi:uncharacterized protein LOC109723448 [Ananas comosus]|uniref:Uncharacterized protein LOC109723448 n=1 Tax=Ananas comosus TaxID=4615 RepID=A0A6P5GMY7_ANACO|nr:uncharacterized protein LOC109723448 [Ananas comosus]